VSDLSPIAPAPLREPLAGVALVPRADGLGSWLDVGLTDRAHGVRFDATLHPTAAIAGVPVANGVRDVCATYSGGTAPPTLGKCAPSDAPVDLGTIGPADAIAAGTLVSPAGAALGVVAARDPSTGELRLRSGELSATIAGAGAQIAIADLDGDGDPEIVTGADVLAASEDALVVSSWHPGGAVRERARIAVPAGVRAIAACPPSGSGAAPIAIATASGEVWVVR
jgi:hypothetical protein